MPDNFLSRPTVDHLSAIDPFSPDLAKLQAAENDIICLKHFSKHASWLQGTPKSTTNRLAPLVSKNWSQEYTLWIRLSDSNRPRMALFLPGRFWKRAMCWLTAPHFLVMMLSSKPTFDSPTTTSGRRLNLTSQPTSKHVSNAKWENVQILKNYLYNQCLQVIC